MSDKKSYSGRLSKPDINEFPTADSGIKSAGGLTEPRIEPSESDRENSNIENQSGDPGRTPGKAEGTRETVEEDLKEKDLEKNQNSQAS